jgi:hypothetical protein
VAVASDIGAEKERERERERERENLSITKLEGHKIRPFISKLPVSSCTNTPTQKHTHTHTHTRIMPCTTKENYSANRTVYSAVLTLE